MAYIGKQPLVGNYTVLDSLTATTTDTYALTKNSVAVFPQTPANCIVSLNGVIQAPYDSYTISGSNIVFASALTASDSIDFITVLGDVLNVGTVSDGTIGLAKLSATGTKDATTFLRGDNTFAVPAGGTNTPAFAATKSSQTLVDATATIIQLDTEVFDTDSCYDTSTYKFTPNVSGKYFVYFKMYLDSNANNRVVHIESDIMKNLSSIDRQSFLANTTAYEGGVGTTQICFVEMNGTTDYIQAKVYGNVSAGDVFITQAKFGAYKIIE